MTRHVAQGLYRQAEGVGGNGHGAQRRGDASGGDAGQGRHHHLACHRQGDLQTLTELSAGEGDLFAAAQLQLRGAQQQIQQQEKGGKDLGQCGAQCGAQYAQTGAGENKAAQGDGSRGENEQGVEHHIQETHQHHAGARHLHVAAGAQQ